MVQSYSLPTINWVRFPGGDEPLARDEPTAVCSLEDVLDAASWAGFDAVGLYDDSLAAFLRVGGALAQLPQMLRSRGLACTDVGILRIGGGDAKGEARTLAGLAASTGATVCVTTLAVRPSPAVVRELAACASLLFDAGARLAVEPVPYAPLTTLAEASVLCDAVGWERCGLLLDSWHFFRGDRPWELLKSLDAAQIALVHVNDAPPASTDSPLFESRFRREILGAGAFPIGELRSAVDAVGYAGTISPEILSTRLRSLPPTEAATEIMRSLRRHWPFVEQPTPSARPTPGS